MVFCRFMHKTWEPRNRRLVTSPQPGLWHPWSARLYLQGFRVAGADISGDHCRCRDACLTSNDDDHDRSPNANRVAGVQRIRTRHDEHRVNQHGTRIGTGRYSCHRNGLVSGSICDWNVIRTCRIGPDSCGIRHRDGVLGRSSSDSVWRNAGICKTLPPLTTEIVTHSHVPGLSLFPIYAASRFICRSKQYNH